jgi:hypothetical protein
LKLLQKWVEEGKKDEFNYDIFDKLQELL